MCEDGTLVTLLCMVISVAHVPLDMLSHAYISVSHCVPMLDSGVMPLCVSNAPHPTPSKVEGMPLLMSGPQSEALSTKTATIKTEF